MRGEMLGKTSMMRSALIIASMLMCAASKSAKPNILFMMADQMRGDLVSSDLLDLPNINSIGENGVRFSKAYTATPSCTPARAAILTGRSPWNHGMLGYGEMASEYPFEMPRALRDLAGYRTAVVGKDHFGRNKSAVHGYEFLEILDAACYPGDDDYTKWFHRLWEDQPVTIGWPGLDYNCWKGRPYALLEEYHPTAWVGRTAVNWLKENGTKLAEEEVPWLLKVSFHRPHSPYSPPGRFLKKIKEENLPPVRVAEDQWDARYKDEPPCKEGANLTASCDQWCGQMPYREMTLGRRAYRAEAAFVDHWVGNILETMREQGLMDNTLVIWTSDHGDCQGDHFLHRKGYPYDCSASVPMLLQWPQGIVLPGSAGGGLGARGMVSDKLVELRDILPTFLDAAGVWSDELASKVDGRSLLCFVRGTCQGWREWLDLEHNTVYHPTVHWNALTDGEIKYVFEALHGTEQLFNMSSDPFEARNVIADPRYAATLKLWRARLLKQWQGEGRGSSWYDNHGNLLPRPRGLLYSPHYPGPHLDLFSDLYEELVA